MSYESMRKYYFANGPQAAAEEYVRRMNSPAVWKIGFAMGGKSAFVMLVPDLLMLIERLHGYEKELALIDSTLPDALRRRCLTNLMIDEIRQTNEIENVHSTRREILSAVDSMRNPSSRKQRVRFEGMVRKYDKLLSGQPDVPVTCADIRAIYNELVLSEVAGEDAASVPDGTLFRKDKVYVQNAHADVLHEGFYPESEIVRGMEAALTFANDESVSAFVRAAVFHVLFAVIHPFYDGNGRMARYLTASLLTQAGFSPYPLLRLSYVIISHRAKYYKAFRDAEDKRGFGDLTEFVLTMLGFIEEAMVSCHDALTSALERYRALIGVLNRCEAMRPCADVLTVLIENALFEDEGLSVTALTDAVCKSRSTVEKQLALCRERLTALQIEKDGRRLIYRLDSAKAFDELSAVCVNGCLSFRK